MPTERRGPFCNSQYEGIPNRVIDNGPTKPENYPPHLKHLSDTGSLRDISIVFGEAPKEKRQGVLARMFDRREDDAYSRFRHQGLRRTGISASCSACPVSSPVSAGSAFGKTTGRTIKKIAPVIMTISKPFNLSADIWADAKPVAAAVLYWGITLGGAAAMAAGAYHIITNDTTSTSRSLFLPQADEPEFNIPLPGKRPQDRVVIQDDKIPVPTWRPRP